MLSRPWKKKQNLKKNSAKLRPTSFLGAKFKGTCELLEDRRVMAAFNAGDVVVYRVGTGTGSLVNTGNTVFLDEFSPSGVPQQSLQMPTTASGAQNQLISSGVASSEGFITRSSDGAYLQVTGYARNLGGSGSLASTTGSAVPRVVGRVDGAGAVDTSTKFTDFSSGNNPRSATSIDGTHFWLAGGAGGIRYGDFNDANNLSDRITQTTPTDQANARVVEIFDGQLYTSSSSGTFGLGVGAVGSGTPTGGPQTSTRLNGLSDVLTPNVYGYYFADLSAGVSGVDTLYVADEEIGVTKFTLVSGTWTSNSVVGVNADDYRGLTGTVSAGTVTLYATRKGGTGAAGGGELVKITDTAGYNGAFSATPALLATAAPNTAFRGVALAPVAPSAAPVVTATGSALSYAEDAGAVASTLR